MELPESQVEVAVAAQLQWRNRERVSRAVWRTDRGGSFNGQGIFGRQCSARSFASRSRPAPRRRYSEPPRFSCLRRGRVPRRAAAIAAATAAINILGLHKGAPTEESKSTAKRPDLKAISKASIEVGYQFYSRAEMVACSYELPVAVAIVISGMYEDDLDNAEDVVYTGQGGHNLTGDKRQIRDQKLERGNLALKVRLIVWITLSLGLVKNKILRDVIQHERSYLMISSSVLIGRLLSFFTCLKLCNLLFFLRPIVDFFANNCAEQCVPVRVIRGHESSSSYTGKVYTYDGLYKVVNYWAEKGISGFTVYKFRLRRLEGQPTLTTNQDITGGQEDMPIPATNLVDDPPVPPTGKFNKGLVEAKDVVFECGPECGCGPGCVNRTSQRGLRYRLEVFRTAKKGWAVRSWDFIPSGAPVCEYTGILARAEDMDSVLENNYIFEIDCLQTIKGLGGRERRSQDGDIPANLLDKYHDQCSESAPEFCIDAGSTGNIARFINHCCEPNLFVQCVLSTHNDLRLARVMLFAADNIPPLQELTYDYGYVLDSVLDSDGKIKQMPCYCGASFCAPSLHFSCRECYSSSSSSFVPCELSCSLCFGASYNPCFVGIEDVHWTAPLSIVEALDWEMVENLQEEMKGSGLHLKGMMTGLIRVVKEMEKEVVEVESITAVASDHYA
ncbi:hypothetical protein JHK85_053924 [Glycine max]|nr:hypothetical protein JHK85_053924 [Glycine max]